MTAAPEGPPPAAPPPARPEGRPRVVVTGMGAMSPLGESVAEFWAGLVEGRSGIDRMTITDPTDFPCKFSGRSWASTPPTTSTAGRRAAWRASRSSP